MKKLLALVLAAMLLLGCVPALAEDAPAVPKYVFLFIGDGMGNPLVTATQYYLGAVENPDAKYPTPAQLSFTQFPYLGLMTTYDASSFVPDSAATASAMSSGHKVPSGMINYNAVLDELTPMTEYIKPTGKKIGVLTSVSLDHATPAAFYTTSMTRDSYIDIALNGVDGDVLDFWGGGSFLQNATDLMKDIATGDGWTVASTPAEIRALAATGSRVLAYTKECQSQSSLYYEIDRKRMKEEGKDALSLAELLQAGINVLDNDNGFFIMCEGGKVDWSSHANDAATSINEVIGLSDAVKVAMDFAQAHPDETLIVVTSDHETGGMTVGFATTAYSTNLQLLKNQTMSFQDFTTLVMRMDMDGYSFEDVLLVVEKYFGLTTKKGSTLSLTEDELEALRAAYDISIGGGAKPDNAALLYGGYEPLAVAVTRILNNKAGLSYTTYSHTGLQIPVYAMGVGAENFAGLYDNTDIFYKMMKTLNIDVEAKQ